MAISIVSVGTWYWQFGPTVSPSTAEFVLKDAFPNGTSPPQITDVIIIISQVRGVNWVTNAAVNIDPTVGVQIFPAIDYVSDNTYAWILSTTYGADNTNSLADAYSLSGNTVIGVYAIPLSGSDFNGDPYNNTDLANIWSTSIILPYLQVGGTGYAQQFNGVHTVLIVRGMKNTWPIFDGTSTASHATINLPDSTNAAFGTTPTDGANTGSLSVFGMIVAAAPGVTDTGISQQPKVSGGTANYGTPEDWNTSWVTPATDVASAVAIKVGPSITGNGFRWGSANTITGFEYLTVAINYLPGATTPLYFSVQPVGVGASIGSTVTLNVTAVPGVGSITYKWQKSTNNGATWAFISGATSSSYTTPTLTLADSGAQYRAAASDDD